MELTTGPWECVLALACFVQPLFTVAVGKTAVAMADEGECSLCMKILVLSSYHHCGSRHITIVSNPVVPTLSSTLAPEVLTGSFAQQGQWKRVVVPDYIMSEQQRGTLLLALILNRAGPVPPEVFWQF
eukprot:5554730-Amphidinium_carterae.1